MTRATNTNGMTSFIQEAIAKKEEAKKVQRDLSGALWHKKGVSSKTDKEYDFLSGFVTIEGVDYEVTGNLVANAEANGKVPTVRFTIGKPREAKQATPEAEATL